MTHPCCASGSSHSLWKRTLAEAFRQHPAIGALAFNRILNPPFLLSVSPSIRQSTSPTNDQKTTTAKLSHTAAMAEDRQPASVTEGADVEDENPVAKSAEDRKAQAALSKLDAKDDDDSTSKEVDRDAVNRAMNNLGGDASKTEKKEVKKIKVDAADVALLVDQLDLTKPKATDLLKAHDGDAVKAMRAYVAAN